METKIPNVVVTRDGGHECWDTTISARDIAKAFQHGLLEVDPDHQRGENTITGEYMLKKEKVERWARQLQEDTAIFGQLTWNFRPESSEVDFEPDPANPIVGSLIVRDGSAFLPDSVHRHYAIKRAVESVAAGSSFDPARRFSLRVWKVPEEFENDIFYAMNMEHDKADATRSKWLAQKNAGQKIAREVVRRSAHLGEGNVETVTNTLSIKNARLAAFNTLASGFEEAWADIPEESTEKAILWFLTFWDKMVSVMPQLGKLTLTERQKCRKESLVGAAIAIQGYIRLARELYANNHNLGLLDRLVEPVVQDGESYDFFAWNNPLLQSAGILVPSINKKGETTLTARNSHQTRRAMAEVLAAKVGMPEAAQDSESALSAAAE
jgi:hypothetical protein